MRSAYRAFNFVMVASLFFQQFSTIPAHAQQSQQQSPQARAFDPFVNRVRDGLKLNDDQVATLRQILARHAPRVNELRQRAQSNPYAPMLGQEVDKEQRAIREELAEVLDEQQKGLLASFDARVPIQLAPAFVLISITPRTSPDAAAALKLAAAERTIPPPVATASTKAKPARMTDDQRILHLLNRITFGPRPGDLDRVRGLGIEAFLAEQLQPEAIDDSDLEKRLAVLPTQQMTSAELYQFYPPPNVVDERAKQPNPPPVFGRPQQIIGELIQQKLVRAVSSNRQLQEVMTDFWFNHFNVFAQKEADQWLVSSYERDVIRPKAIGKFRDLLLAVAQSPAMMFYLDNWLSAAPDAKEPRPPRPQPPPAQPKPAVKPASEAASASTGSSSPVMSGPEANRGRTPLDEATLKQPNNGSQNGSPEQQVKPADQPKPAPPKPPQQAARKRGINENYARELMELHTLGVDGGYTQKDVQEVARCFTGWTIDRPFQGGGFVFRPWMHDGGSKTVLGNTIPAGGGISDGARVIDVLSRHPSTARFISRKLCERFVSDNPPAQLVERVAQVFLKTDGDIREVLRAILTSAEFNSPAVFRAKVKSPLELTASAIRAVDGDSNGAPAVHEWLRKMGEPLYAYAFPTGYKENSDTWMNTGVFLNRLNFGVAFANSQIQGTNYDASRLVSPDISASSETLTARLSTLIVHTELSADSKRAVLSGLDLTGDAHKRTQQAIGLLLGTTEFQKR